MHYSWLPLVCWQNIWCRRGCASEHFICYCERWGNNEMPFFCICGRCLIISCLLCTQATWRLACLHVSEPRMQLLVLPSKDLQREAHFKHLTHAFVWAVLHQVGLLQWAGVAQSTVPVPDVHSCLQSEQEVRITQSEFDRQAEITRLLLEGISSTHVSTQKVLRRKGNIRCLLKKAAVNYLGTLVCEVLLQCIKASNHKGWGFFLNSNIHWI